MRVDRGRPGGGPGKPSMKSGVGLAAKVVRAISHALFPDAEPQCRTGPHPVPRSGSGRKDDRLHDVDVHLGRGGDARDICGDSCQVQEFAGITSSAGPRGLIHRFKDRSTACPFSSRGRSSGDPRQGWTPVRGKTRIAGLQRRRQPGPQGRHPLPLDGAGGCKGDNGEIQAA